MTRHNGPIIRHVRDEDAQDLLGLLALCFAEYPGCYVDPQETLTDMLRPAADMAERGGAFWVVEDGRGRISASVAVDMAEPGEAELHRLYVRPDMRGQGLGAHLVDIAEAWARERGAGRMALWSDTRFAAGHRLYGRLGYRQVGGQRELHDISRSVEQRFEKGLTG